MFGEILAVSLSQQTKHEKLSKKNGETSELFFAAKFRAKFKKFGELSFCDFCNLSNLALSYTAETLEAEITQDASRKGCMSVTCYLVNCRKEKSVGNFGGADCN